MHTNAIKCAKKNHQATRSSKQRQSLATDEDKDSEDKAISVVMDVKRQTTARRFTFHHFTPKEEVSQSTERTTRPTPIVDRCLRRLN